MAEKEKLHVKLGIRGTYWKKVPHYVITFNNSIIKEADISQPSDVVEYVEFDAEYDTDSVSISVRLTNKEDSDVQKDSYDDPENYKIIGDMLLTVESLEVDEIDLGNLLFDQGVYTVDSPVEYDGEVTSTIKNCMTMGWNGVWSLGWTNPFYIWMLENI